jgi:hypothetical protein
VIHIDLETVIGILLSLMVLAFLAVFLRHGFAKRVPSSSGDVALLVEHGFSQSEIGLAWAELSKCPGLELKRDWGSGMLAMAVRDHVRQLEQREAALLEAMREIATCSPTGRDSLVRYAQRGIEENERLRAGGEAADTAPGQGSSAEGKHAAR